MAMATRPLAVVAVDTQLVDQRLRVDAMVRDAQGKRCVARVPDRELATLLPRSILAADGSPPAALLDTIRAIVERMVVGRHVRLWEYRDQRYLAFLSWRSVRFTTTTPATPPGAGAYTPNDSMSRSVRESSTSVST
jgi:hypothetical protein